MDLDHYTGRVCRPHSLRDVLTMYRCHRSDPLHYHEYLDVAPYQGPHLSCIRKLLHQLHVSRHGAVDYGLDL